MWLPYQRICVASYDFDEYAVVIGAYSAFYESDIYIFKGDKMLRKHRVFHKGGLDIKHFKGPDGKTIMYYNHIFGSESGIYQANTFFYQLDGEQVKPVLNLPQSSYNYTGLAYRSYSFQSEKVDSNEMSLKFQADGNFTDYVNDLKANYEKERGLMVFDWDNSCQCFTSASSNLLHLYKLATYTMADNNLLFINLYADELKTLLDHDYKNEMVLIYLYSVYYEIEEGR